MHGSTGCEHTIQLLPSAPQRAAAALLLRTSVRAVAASRAASESRAHPRTRGGRRLSANAMQLEDCMPPPTQAMSKACCPTPQACDGHSLPKTCGTACALSFVPMYHDCLHMVDSVFDVHSSDHTQDGKVRATEGRRGAAI